MSKSNKRVVIDDRTVARVQKAGFAQDTRGTCLICSGNFRECPHPFAQVQRVIEIVSQTVEFDVQISARKIVS